MRRARTLKGWRLFAIIGLSSYAFFLVAFSLAKVVSGHGGRWSISWPAVVWVATGAALAVSLATLLDSGKK